MGHIIFENYMSKNPYNMCVYRTQITVKAEKVLAKTYNIRAFCFPIFEWEVVQGYFFRKEFQAGECTLKADDFDLKAFRINITDFEKEKFQTTDKKPEDLESALQAV